MRVPRFLRFRQSRASLPFLALLLALLLALGLAGCEREAAPGGRDATTPLDASTADGALSDAALADGALPDGAITACSTLDLSACRLQPTCAADLCYLCSCTPVFEGCRLLGDPPFECPQVGCPQPLCCATPSDCESMGGDCAPPGTPYGCGMCNPETGDCTADGDCAGGSICQPIPCSCDVASQCVPGCALPADCPLGSTCSGTEHPRCLPSACSPTLPCPPDFDCANSLCARRPCTKDLDCDHFCVSGLCYEGQGECRLPAP